VVVDALGIKTIKQKVATYSIPNLLFHYPLLFYVTEAQLPFGPIQKYTWVSIERGDLVIRSY
jgi:hypothetical protein